MRCSLALAVFVAVALLVPCMQVRATTVSQNGTIVATDDFEGDAVGSPPVADVGEWVDTYFGYYTIAAVTDVATPGAFSGSQYLRVAGGHSVGAAISTLASGDTVRFETMVYFPTALESIDYPWQFALISLSGERLFNFWRNVSGTWEGEGAGVFTPHPSYAYGAWQKWEFDYVVGQASATLTIDGSSAPVPATNANAMWNPYFRFGFFVNYENNPAVEIFLDDVPSVPGDFDSDGDVDGADFVAWQTNFPKASGANLAEGDADGDGDVDGADFVVWQTNFPFTPSPGVAPVPEPQSILLIIVGTLLCGIYRRKTSGG